MRRRLDRTARASLLGLAALPLLAVGPCLSIAFGATITGLFNALTPVLVEALKDCLGT